MGYPDNFNSAAFDAAMDEDDEVIPRELTADEREAKRLLEEIDVRLEKLSTLAIFEDDQDGRDQQECVVIDGRGYVMELLALIDMIPEREAERERERLRDERP